VKKEITVKAEMSANLDPPSKAAGKRRAIPSSKAAGNPVEPKAKGAQVTYLL
jgi:hypothetical protein